MSLGCVSVAPAVVAAIPDGEQRAEGGEAREEGPSRRAANSGEPHVAGMQSVETNHA